MVRGRWLPEIELQKMLDAIAPRLRAASEMKEMN